MMSDSLVEVVIVCFSNIGPSAFKKLLCVCAKAKDLRLENFTDVNAIV